PCRIYVRGLPVTWLRLPVAAPPSAAASAQSTSSARVASATPRRGSGRGGIGRHARFRFSWPKAVGVQVPPSAPNVAAEQVSRSGVSYPGQAANEFEG